MTTVDEIAEGVFRISTHVPYGPPGGITFNQFVIDDDEPMLVHTGMRVHFDQTFDALRRVLEPARLRWVTSNHASRPDELGALSQWFAVAPQLGVVHGEVACRVNLTDVVGREVRPVADGEVVRIGARGVRWTATPHVPGPWEAGNWFDDSSGVMFTGDLFAQAGDAPAMTDGDIVGPALAHDSFGHGTALTPATAPTLRELADLEPVTLALMHGPSFAGDGPAALRALADHFEAQLQAELCER